MGPDRPTGRNPAVNLARTTSATRSMKKKMTSTRSTMTGTKRGPRGREGANLSRGVRTGGNAALPLCLPPQPPAPGPATAQRAFATWVQSMIQNLAPGVQPPPHHARARRAGPGGAGGGRGRGTHGTAGRRAPPRRGGGGGREEGAGGGAQGGDVRLTPLTRAHGGALALTHHAAAGARSAGVTGAVGQEFLKVRRSGTRTAGRTRPNKKTPTNKPSRLQSGAAHGRPSADLLR